jgi:Polysaccharide lyase family 4, domain II
MSIRKTFLASVLLSTGALLAVRIAAQAPKYEVITVSDGGTITGTVKWTGARPSPLTLPISKNPDICDPDKKGTRDLERLVIGPDGGVANTVVFLKNITKGKEWDLPPARQSLDQKTCHYSPHIMLVQQHGNLNMKSSDPILHNIHMAGAAFYNIPFPIQDKVITRPFQKDGVVDLKCDAGHVWMNSEILVVQSPYYAVTDEHGNFKLTNVPPGDYEITAWHEGWHVARQESFVDVDAHQERQRPIFNDPRTWDSKVTVPPKGTAKANFEISEK